MTTTEGRIGNDPADMTGRVHAFADQMRSAWDLAAQGPELLGAPAPERIYVIGMGGSAIGGDFLRAYAERHGEVSVEVVRGYELPGAANRKAFGFFVSYSGGTEETLSCWEEACKRGMPRACITSGGELGRRAREAGVPVLEIPPGAPPRSALGWTSVPLLHAMGKAGAVKVTEADLDEAVEACRQVLAEYGSPGPGNALQAWAEGCADRLPVIYASDSPHRVSAMRWACQLNENGKSVAHYALFPEQNHNEIVGWEEASPVLRRTQVAVLDDAADHPRVRRRMEIVVERLKKAGAPVAHIRPKGKGLLARLYSFSTQADLASLYLAAARNVDPTPVASIDALKAALARG